MTTSDEAAHKLAELMLVMRIEVRKLAYNKHGDVGNQQWDVIYKALRQYEDAQVQEMLNDPGHQHRKRRRIRQDKKLAKIVSRETRVTARRNKSSVSQSKRSA